MSTTRTTAIAALEAGPVEAEKSFVPIDLDLDEPGPHDLLVEVRAVSVNPVDVKVRASFGPDAAPKVLGFDAAGTVVATGSRVQAFEVGDEVYYAGSIARHGSNAARQLVDEHLVGHKPAALDFAEAAALPLTALTAWESLFEHFGLTEHSTGTLLVVGGAGGVGSILIQLARMLTDVTVVATASRPASQEWVGAMGAHAVVNHHDLDAQVRAVVPAVNWIFSPFSAGNVQTYADLMAPRGEVVAIDEPEGLDTLPLKSKSQTWHWELMFTRPLYEPDSPAHREILDRVARLVDDGVLRTTISERLHGLQADTVREAHLRIESGSAVGKLVIEA